jgi:transcription elongation factor Elf1
MMWLETKYASLLGSQLKLFKKTRNNVYNFRCPFCGDSDVSKTKARGYFYASKKNNLRYRCHNCGTGMSFYDFIKEIDPTMFQEFRMELFKERQSSITSVRNSGTRGNSSEELEYSARKTKKRTPQKPNNSTLMGMKSLSKLPDDHEAVLAMRARKVPEDAFKSIYYTPKMADVAHQMDRYKKTRFDEYPRVVFPFVDSEGIMTHLQGRAIGKVPKGSRYVTLEIEDAPKVFGADKIDKTKTVFVVEGPIDSLFLSNCVGMGGADVDFSILAPSTTCFIFDNERRNSEIIKRMTKVSDMGYGVCVWGKEVNENDINDMILAGWKKEDLEAYILSHTFRGLKAKLAIADYSLI